MSVASIRLELWDIAPELQPEDADTEGLAKVDRFIERAKRKVEQSVVGNEYDELVAYKAAELLTRATPEEAITTGLGEVIEEKVGKAHYKYATVAKSRAERIKEFSDYFDERMGILSVGGFITSNGGCY